MQYSNVVKAEFIERPNRFAARVLVEGREETAHVRNTGRCRELLVPGAVVYLEDFAGRMGSRKLRYSLIAVEKESLPAGKTLSGDIGQAGICESKQAGKALGGGIGQADAPNVKLINMDSQAPNKVVQEALSNGTIRLPEMAELRRIRPETTYGDSRFDFYICDTTGREAFVEVKGVTLETEGIAAFPDAPTERGVRHLRELIRASEQGFGAYIIFVLQMDGMKAFTPNDARHAAFGEALRLAYAGGVHVLAYACRLTPDMLQISVPVQILL